MLSIFMYDFCAVNCAQPLFSQTKISGKFHSAARFIELVERALIGGPVAEKHDGDAILALEARSKGAAQRDRHSGADDFVRPADARLLAGDMHRTGIAVARTVGAAKNLRHERLQLHAFRQRVAMAAVRRENRVSRREARANAGRDRFLADAHVNEAGNFALGELFLKALLDAPYTNARSG